MGAVRVDRVSEDADDTCEATEPQRVIGSVASRFHLLAFCLSQAQPAKPLMALESRQSEPDSTRSSDRCLGMREPV